MRISNLQRVAAVADNTVEAEPWAEALIPRVLPAGWTMTTVPFVGFFNGDGLRVLFSARTEADGKRWLHVSLSRPNRLPSWADVQTVKDIFVGPDRVAVQVLPRKQDYVNVHPNCLHLWCCLDGDPVPDFRTEGTI